MGSPGVSTRHSRGPQHIPNPFAVAVISVNLEHASSVNEQRCQDVVCDQGRTDSKTKVVDCERGREERTRREGKKRRECERLLELVKVGGSRTAFIPSRVKGLPKRYRTSFVFYHYVSY